jgi:hypothetical protein
VQSMSLVLGTGVGKMELLTPGAYESVSLNYGLVVLSDWLLQ